MISRLTVQLVFFRLHLVLHACAARFDVMGTAQKFLGTNLFSWQIFLVWGGTVALSFVFGN